MFLFSKVSCGGQLQLDFLQKFTFRYTFMKFYKYMLENLENLLFSWCNSFAIKVKLNKYFSLMESKFFK